MWALGVLAYELLMGRSPFATGSGGAYDDFDDGPVQRIINARPGCHGLRASAEARAFVEARARPSLPAATPRPTPRSPLDDA